MIPPCYVITLNENLGEQGEKLKEVGLNPITFHGVDARKDEHFLYTDYVDPDCLQTCPKSVIGCGLSHILLARHIYYTGASIAIIMEDDAFPIVENINEEIQKVISEVPDDWQIIKMHCDSHCKNGTNLIDTIVGSAAAYLINRRGMEIMMNTRVEKHIDIQQLDILKIYKTSTNLFRTDESSSTNKIKSGISVSPVLDYIMPITSGEKTWDDMASFKLIRIPVLDKELNVIQVIGLLVLLLLIVCILI